MFGFEGDPEKAAALRAALEGLLAVFPEHPEKPEINHMTFREDVERSRQFEAIVRAHKKERLKMPIQALEAVGASDHDFTYMAPRRLAWFVPSLLAAWLDRQPMRFGVFHAGRIESIARDTEIKGGADWMFEEEEAAALGSFFETALDAALATPLGPEASSTTRPLEDGVRVWSLHGPSVPLDVLRVAKALRVDIFDLVTRWALDESPLALDHLLEAVFDSTVASKHYLSHELVANRLYEAFFDASGERALRLSKAEATVRRNIVRREDA